MNSATQSVTFQGQSGAIEALCDAPVGGVVRGTAVIAHPHPLFGGTMQNKVVQTLARAFVQCGGRLCGSIFEVWAPVLAFMTKDAARRPICWP